MMENEPHKMMIEVIGPGCPFCRKLHKRVREVVAEQGMEAEIVHVTDLMAVLKHIPFTPVLKVNGEIVHRGKWLPGKDKLREFIKV